MPDRQKYTWIHDPMPSAGLVARAVLNDAAETIDWLENETKESRFRVLLVAAIALLRTVGHALKNTDAQNRPELRGRIEEAYLRWTQDKNSARIFWEFILRERNNILKQYELRVQFQPMVTASDADHAWRVGSYVFCPIVDGPYAGEHVREVLIAAVQWWDKELSNLEDGMD